MRLINVQTLTLQEFPGEIPKYAILSHTWGDDEVTFQDFTLDIEGAKLKKGFEKIQYCIGQTESDGLQYCWVDTCCIDKSSSAELSEAINSMFAWYRSSERCYIYLADVDVRVCQSVPFADSSCGLAGFCEAGHCRSFWRRTGGAFMTGTGPSCVSSKASDKIWAW
jgi:hypothetical protein